MMADVEVMEVSHTISSPEIKSSTTSNTDETSSASLSSSTKEDDSEEGEEPAEGRSNSEENLPERPLRLILNNEQTIALDSDAPAATTEAVKNGDHTLLHIHDTTPETEAGGLISSGENGTPFGDDVKGEEEQQQSASSSGLTDVVENVIKIAEEIVPVTPTCLKKSNLKRLRSNLETPETAQMAPKRKKIRIVENLEAMNCNNYMQFEGDVCENLEAFKGADETAVVTEVESAGEKVTWLTSSSSNIDQTVVNVEFVRANLSPVKRNFSVEIDMRFILTETVTSILACKVNVSNIGPSDFDQWIARNALHNLPELKFVYKEGFVKMANLDAVLEFDLTSPKECAPDDIYYVGDLYQDSKGFREYFLWKTSQSEKVLPTKLLGIQTLGPRTPESKIFTKAGLLHRFNRDAYHNLKSGEEFSGLPTEIVEEFEAEGPEAHNILDVNVLNEFVEFVKIRTAGRGLHLLVADNTEICHVYESCREIRFQKNFYCVCLLALRCIREGGTFVCKIFDTITLFTNGLLFLLYKCFKSITIHKPFASPVHSAERFLVCKGKIENQDSKYVIDFLSDCLDMVVNNQEQRKIVRRKIRKRLAILRMEVQALVPLKLILSHAEFFQFVRLSNIRLSSKLVESIESLCAAMENKDKTSLKELASTLKESNVSRLSKWNLSLKPSYLDSSYFEGPLEFCKHFFHERNLAQELLVSLKETKLETAKALIDLMSSKESESPVAFPVLGVDKRGVFESQRGLFFGCGQSKILHFDPHSSSWKLLDVPEIALPRGSLVIGEIAEEIHEKKFVRCFHIFDVIFISGVFLGANSFQERQALGNRWIQCIRNSSKKLNENLSFVSPLRMSELNNFYLRTCKKNYAGYAHSNVRYYQKDGQSESTGSTALFRGFLVLTPAQNAAPVEFFKGYQQFVHYLTDSEGDWMQNMKELE